VNSTLYFLTEEGGILFVALNKTTVIIKMKIKKIKKIKRYK
jgi:hypothetical protein